MASTTTLVKSQLERIKQLDSADGQTSALLSFPDWLPNVTPQWIWTWKHQEYIYKQLERITNGECKRLMIFIPPRHAKSETVTVRYSIWRLYQNPSLRIILGAYNQILANKFSRKARRVAVDAGVSLDKERYAVEDWQTASGGGIRAVGVGGGVTGQGGNLIIIDDPVKNREEANSETYREKVWDWYKDDLYTRLEPDGAICLIMTRWHSDDLAGRLLEEARQGGEQWEIVNLPALAEDDDPLGREIGAALCPDRYNVEALLRIKQVLGSSFYALYQQRPQPASGSVFQLDWIHYGNAPQTQPTLIVQAWDTAMKAGKENDYSVCVTAALHGTTAYILHVYRAKLETPELLKRIRSQFDEWQPHVVIMEDKASGTGAIQVIKKTEYQSAMAEWQKIVDALPKPLKIPVGSINATQQQQQLPTKPIIIPIVAVQADKDKVSRANLVTPYLESGRVVFCRGAWNDDMQDEMLSFPNGKHDDQVDALVYALLRLFGKNQKKAQQFNPYSG